MMLEFIVKQNIIFYLMGALFVLGILAKLFSVLTARKLVKEAKDIHNSNHRLMRLVKAKFEHASMISDRVENVAAFVNKFMYEYKVVGMRIQTYRSFPTKIMWGIGILGIFAIFESYQMIGFKGMTMEYIQWTSIFFLLLAILQFAKEEQIYLAAAQNYMVEYLENVCVHRYLKKNAEPEVIEEPIQVEPIEVKEPELPPQIEEEEEKKSDQEMRIRAILEEFLA